MHSRRGNTLPLIWQSAYSEEASSSSSRSPAAFLHPRMESEEINTYSPSPAQQCQSRMSENIQLQPITPPTCGTRWQGHVSQTAARKSHCERMFTCQQSDWDRHSAVKCWPYYVQSEDELLLNLDMTLIGLLSKYLGAYKPCCRDVKAHCSEREGEMFDRGNKMMRP